jgi:hypothetical protein
VTALLRILFLAPVAFAMACAAAAGVVVFAVLRDLTPGPLPYEMVALVAAATVVVAVYAALPSLVAILLAEAFGWRSLLYWLAVGGLMAAVVAVTPYLAGQLEFVADLVVLAAWLPRMNDIVSSEPLGFTTVVFAAGFTGGFVDWLVAGRLAGFAEPISPGSGQA